MRSIFSSAVAAVMCVAAVSANAVFGADDAHPGAKTYGQCAACHLADGKGVAGAFPPLGANAVKLAQSDAGRDYLTFVVLKGLNGPIMVEGARYMGYMPQIGAGLSDVEIANLLNYITVTLAGASDVDLFTAQEIASRRSEVVGAYKPNTVKSLRDDAMAALSGE